MVRLFEDNNHGDAHTAFQKWRAENYKRGLLINCRRSGGWMLHTAACDVHLGDTDWEAGIDSLTQKLKVCRIDRKELVAWAREQGVSELKECSDCCKMNKKKKRGVNDVPR